MGKIEIAIRVDFHELRNEESQPADWPPSSRSTSNPADTQNAGENASRTRPRACTRMSTLTKTVMNNRITITRTPILSPCPLAPLSPVPLLAERRKGLKNKLVGEWASSAE